MLKNLTLPHYILIGLLAWGLPGFFVAGSQAVIAVAAASIPVWLCTLGARDESPVQTKFKFKNQRLILIVLFIYLFLDATIGRQKFADNLFFSRGAVASFIGAANENVSRGRGIAELLGAIAIFIPFTLWDFARRAHSKIKLYLYLFALIFIVYEIGISRGYLFMAVLSILLGSRLNLRSIAYSFSGTMAVFLLASYVRGDFNDISFSNPLFDAVAWPYLNLSLLLAKNPPGGTWLDFIMEFIKKFIPSFLYQKEIFSFNIEMTKLIYPRFENFVESISIFTYLGELLYYKPVLITSAIAGTLLGVLSRFAERLIKLRKLDSTRIFSGLMCVVLLRSRVQDVFSFLIFLTVFLLLWELLSNLSPRKRPPLIPDGEGFSQHG